MSTSYNIYATNVLRGLTIMELDNSLIFDTERRLMTYTYKNKFT